MKKIRLFTLSLCLTMACSFVKSQSNQDYRIVPVPEQLTPVQGYFKLTSSTTVYAGKATTTGKFLTEKLSKATGYNISLTKKQKGASISLILNKKIKGEEAYTLSVTPSCVTAEASTEKGLFYAVQSLLQLLPPQIESDKAVQGIEWKAAACQIQDKPRFGYRGILIDVCRHFFPISQLKKHIDLLSMYKINTIHLHLTEDQAWRIEIKKYPKLTEIGQWRQTENGPLGGYYTQEQLKDLVSYAQQHGINIIPEFEIPGHELAAIAAYPWLSCNNSIVQPRPSWGIEPIVMCPAKETTFKFLEDVVDELVKIFPSPIYHIGGDEAPRQSWEKCPLCQKLIKEMEFKDEEGSPKESKLQSYIVSHMEKYFNKYGKSIIGWDEILQGGNLNQSAIVMSWRGEQGGIKAASAGHRVIMVPYTYLYIDYHQGESCVEPQGIGGNLPLEYCYNYDPIPAAIAEKGFGDKILGPQANLWAEYLPTCEKQDYMLYPRCLALAEIGWSQKANKNFTDFAQRLDNDAMIRLNAHHATFHIPLPEQVDGSSDFVAFTDEASISFKTTRPEKMVFTLDGTEPTPQSQVYTEPIKFKESGIIKIATLLSSGFMSKVRTIQVEKQQFSPKTPIMGDLKPGLKLQYVKGTYRKTEELATVSQWQEKEVNALEEINKLGTEDDFSSIATGLIKIEKDGVYFFRSNNAEVWIDGNKVVDNNNNVVKRNQAGGRSMALAAGYHKIKAIYLGYLGAGAPTIWNSGEILYRFGSTGKFKPVTKEMIFQL